MIIILNEKGNNTALRDNERLNEKERKAFKPTFLLDLRFTFYGTSYHFFHGK